MKDTIFPVAMRLGDTPVLIPNTKVKTQTADGTMLETIWESRWLPDISKNLICGKKAAGHLYRQLVFTSDQRQGKRSRFLMADKTSVSGVIAKRH